METNKDQQIIQQVLEGNAQAFAQLVDAHKNLVFTLCLRLLGHREEAEEAAQDSFIKVYRSLDRFKGDSKLSSWIYRIAYNTCLDRLKKDKDRKFLSLDETMENKLPDASGNVIHELEDRDRKQLIQRAFLYLSPEDATLLTLYYLEEQGLPEIEEVLGIAANTLKVQLFRARKRLAAVLKTHIEPEMIQDYGKATP